MLGAFLLGQIPLILEEFARGGGGGSGGGGGGGSGGGGGAGSIFILIGMIGYLPMQFFGGKLRKRYFGKDGWTMARVIGWVVASLIALGLIIIIPILKSFAEAIYFSIPVAIGALIGMGSGLNSWYTKTKQNLRAHKAMTLAAGKDQVWSEKNTIKYAEGVFYKFQQDWTKFDTESMKRYLSPQFHYHMSLMMYALKGAHRVNKVTNPRISSIVINAASDSEDNDKDTFEVAIQASAQDQLFDDRTNRLLFQDNNSFVEYWRFIRQGNTWLFDGIRQATQSILTTRSDIAQFAAENKLYYSADWGWLLLPAEGYLFSGGRFGVSDINNHVIGVVNNVVTQLYTYTANPAGTGDQYLIMQTNVPKTYGRILVRRRSKLFNWPVSKLTKMKMEWGEFNDMYDVYASDLELATSFELLNPAFMAQLRDLPFEVSIEVVDNVVYIFTKATTSVKTYKALYEVVLKAHKEMKL